MLRSTLVLILMSATLTATAANPVPTYVAARHRAALSAWLIHHPAYRLAVDSDCSCQDDIARTRAGSPPDWPSLPDYHPYYIVGDFRGDGAEDVAVGVVPVKYPKKFRVLILHGVPSTGDAGKTFLSALRDLLGQGLFYGAPRPKPWRLGVGAFESEGAVFEPTADGYRLSEDEDD
jgi:hypothetical protein